MTRSSTKELFAPLDNPKRVFCSKRRLFETPGLVESSSTEFDLFSDIEECSKEEATEVMAETMKQYTSKTSGDYGSGVTRPKMDGNGHFELKGQFPKELLDNTFSCSEHEDTNEHIEKVLEIVDLFHIQNITQDQIMLRAFPISLTGAASRWLKNDQLGTMFKSILTAKADSNRICSIGSGPYAVSASQFSDVYSETVPFPRLTVELADRTIKHPKGIAENVLVRIGKFVFPIDFIILDIPEDDDAAIRRPCCKEIDDLVTVYSEKDVC
ncbi:hypothetical protein Tco_1525720 [Tanacetum coccineum]